MVDMKNGTPTVLHADLYAVAALVAGRRGSGAPSALAIICLHARRVMLCFWLRVMDILASFQRPCDLTKDGNTVGQALADVR